MPQENLSTEELINKSLDEIESLATNLESDISKAQPSANPEEVSEDAEAAPTPEEGAEDNAPEEGDGADTDTDSEGQEDEGEEEDEFEKSLESTLKANENVAKSLEVSEFLSEFVTAISGVLSNHTEGLQKSMQASDHNGQLLAKSLLGITKAHQTIMKSQSELHAGMAEINKQLEAIKQQPVVRKSVASNAQPIAKSFEASAGIEEPKQTQTLTKSQASAKLMQAYDGGNTALMTDILALEGTGNFGALSQEAKNVLSIQ